MIATFFIRLIIAAVIFQFILSGIDHVATIAEVEPITVNYKSWIGKLAGCAIFAVLKLLDAIRALIRLTAILIVQLDELFLWFENTYLRPLLSPY